MSVNNRPAVIWWIRRDLRLADNRALDAAIEQARAIDGWVLPLFILDDALLALPIMAEKRLAFLYEGLRALADGLAATGSTLVLRRGNPLAWLTKLVDETSAAMIHAERDHSAYAYRRDSEVANALPLTLHDGLSIRPPGSIISDAGSPYATFTPFKRRWLTLGTPTPPLPAPRQLPADPQLAIFTAENVALDTPAWQPQQNGWPAGEAEAQRRLAAFVGHEDEPAIIGDYAEQRDLPGVDGTSRLSPYLRFGMISARTCAAAAAESLQFAESESDRRGAETWLSELIWRDFYHHLLAAQTSPTGDAPVPKDAARAWRTEKDELLAWQRGETGYPLVDAAMRQLITTGWMHNRCRMVVASFLVKHLLIDWREGERFFMQHLIDGDPAANRGGWRWVAGVGADAAPWFRVFNPTLQAQRFDPAAIYIRRWLPEIAHLPNSAILEPWKISPADSARLGFRPGIDYPFPIVDHAFARARALAQRARA